MVLPASKAPKLDGNKAIWDKSSGLWVATVHKEGTEVAVVDAEDAGEAEETAEDAAVGLSPKAPTEDAAHPHPTFQQQIDGIQLCVNNLVTANKQTMDDLTELRQENAQLKKENDQLVDDLDQISAKYKSICDICGL